MRSLSGVPVVYVSLRLLYTSRSAAIFHPERLAIAKRIAQAMASVCYIELQWPDPYTVDIRRDSPPRHRVWWHVDGNRTEGEERTVKELGADMGHAMRQEWTRYPIRGAVERALLTST